MKTYYSFDIFDTLITRLTATPKGIFLIIQKKIQDNNDIQKELKDNFFKYRIEAEYIARLDDKQEEITLGCIYDILKNKFNLSQSIINFLIEIEIDTEIKNCVINKPNVNKLNKHRPENVLLISDMYLPKEVVVEMLTRVNININVNNIYISSTLNLTKRTGNLYDYIIKNLNIQPHQLEHFGDNQHSDFFVPKKYKIKSTLYTKGDLNILEKNLLSDDTNLTQQLIVGIHKYLRINRPNSLYEVGLSFGALPFLLYSYWCLESANNLKYENLFFVSRDGQILLELATKVKSELPSFNKININYFYISRYASYLLNMRTPIQESDLYIFFPETDVDTLTSLIEKLKLEEFEEEINDLFPNFGKKPLSNIEVNEVIRKLFLNPLIYTHIQEIFTTQKKLAENYCLQNSLDTEKNILIDIGWLGTTYKSLMSNKNINNSLIGFYFGFEAEDYKTNNLRVFSFFRNFFDTKKINPNLLEFLSAANHGTVIGYKKEKKLITPIFKSKNNNKISLRDLNILRKSYYDFTDLFLIQLKNNYIVLPEAYKILNTLSKSISTPEPRLAQELCKYSYSSNVTDSNEIKFVSKLSFLNFIKLYFNYPANVGWIEGSLSITPKYILLLKKSLRFIKIKFKKFVLVLKLF